MLKKITINKIIDVFKFVDYKLFFRKNVHISKKVVLKKKNNNEISLTEILNNKENVILKIDIEGDEYKILNTINKEQKNQHLIFSKKKNF